MGEMAARLQVQLDKINELMDKMINLFEKFDPLIDGMIVLIDQLDSFLAWPII